MACANLNLEYGLYKVFESNKCSSDVIAKTHTYFTWLELKKALASYGKCIFSMTPLSVLWSVCHNVQKLWKLHFHSPIGALVYNRISTVKVYHIRFLIITRSILLRSLTIKCWICTFQSINYIARLGTIMHIHMYVWKKYTRRSEWTLMTLKVKNKYSVI